MTAEEIIIVSLSVAGILVVAAIVGFAIGIFGAKLVYWFIERKKK